MKSWKDRNKIIPPEEQPTQPNFLGVAIVVGLIQLSICLIIAGAIGLIMWILQSVLGI